MHCSKKLSVSKRIDILFVFWALELQCKPLNVITLGHRETDNINQMIATCQSSSQIKDCIERYLWLGQLGQLNQIKGMITFSVITLMGFHCINKLDKHKYKICEWISSGWPNSWLYIMFGCRVKNVWSVDDNDNHILKFCLSRHVVVGFHICYSSFIN